jgi:serine/threonine protein kinase
MMRPQLSTVSVDEDARRRFEAAWRSGRRPDLAMFLPDPAEPCYLATLEELIAIDLEMAWKHHGAAATATSGDQVPPPPLLEHYASAYSLLLRHPDAMIRLAAEEFRVRLACGDRPRCEEYVRRFPQWSREIESALANVDLPHASARPHSPSQEKLGRFRLTVEQGRGGFGVVWRADDESLGRQVAVKELTDAAAHDPAARRRFLAEARIAAQLQHPGVVPIYDVGAETDRPYYAMKLVSGRTLADAIVQHHSSKRTPGERAIEEARLLTAFRSVVQTMAFAHSRNIVHRDLKPQNVVLGEYGETILLDWGLAKDLSATDPAELEETERFGNDAPDATAAGTILGTPAYMSPEQAQGNNRAIDARSDVFALGAILYHLLAGERPFSGSSSGEVLRKVAEASPASLRSVRPDVPRPLEAICRKAMAKDPSHRYVHAGALASDLERYFADEPVSAYAESSWTKLWRWIRRHRQATTIAASAFVLSIGLIVAGLLLRRAQQQRDNQAAARVREAQESATTSERMALARIRDGDFASAANTFAEAAKSLDAWPSLAQDRRRLEEKHDRARRLADFYRLHDRIWSNNYHEFDNEVQESVPIALELIGLTDVDGAPDHLPDSELDDAQRLQLREDAHGLMLIQAVTLGKAVLSDFHKTAKTKEAKEALVWCARAQKRKPTQTIELLQIVLKYSTGEIHPLFIPVALKFVQTRSPQTPTDFHCMGVLHQLLGQAKVLKSEPNGKELIDDTWTFLAFVEKMAGSGLDLANPYLASQRHFREVVRREPRRYWAYVFLGSGLLHHGDFMAAELAFHTCVTVRPDGPEGYIGRAASLYRQSEQSKDESIRQELIARLRADLDAALRYGRHSGEIRFARADMLLRLPNCLELGIEEMSAYLEAERPLHTLKDHWNYQHYRRKAERVAEAANRFRKQSPAAIVPEILAWHALNQPDAVRRLASECRIEGEGAARVKAALGDIAFAEAMTTPGPESAKATETAMKLFQEAVALQPNLYAANIGLARIASKRESRQVGLARLDALVTPDRSWAPWQETEILLLRAEWSAAENDRTKANDSIRRAAQIDLAAARRIAAKLGLDKP